MCLTFWAPTNNDLSCKEFLNSLVGKQWSAQWTLTAEQSVYTLWLASSGDINLKYFGMKTYLEANIDLSYILFLFSFGKRYLVLTIIAIHCWQSTPDGQKKGEKCAIEKLYLYFEISGIRKRINLHGLAVPINFREWPNNRLIGLVTALIY